jgi:hypothetical protein
MNSETTASWSTDDLKKVTCQAFDPANYNYEYLRTPASGNTSTRLGRELFGKITTDSETEPRAVDEIELLSKTFSSSQESISKISEFAVTPFPGNDLKESFPTHEPDVSLASLINRVRQSLTISHNKRIAERLSYLLEVSWEEQPEQAPPSASSIEDFFEFLSSNPELTYPSIVLTANGNIRIQWKRGGNEHFAIEFQGDGNVRFVIFAPDPIHRYKTIRVVGGATVDSVMPVSAPYDVLRWVADNSVEK